MSFYDLCIQNARDLSEISETLYEGDDDFKNIIIEYNRLMYFTRVSQPGHISPAYPKKSLYHSIHNIEKYLPGNYTRQQRAHVGGYMKVEMARYIHSQLKDDEKLILSTGIFDNVSQNISINMASVIFDENNIPLLYDIDEYDIQKDDLRLIPDADATMRINTPYKTFEWWWKHTGCISYPNFQINGSQIIKFDITAVEWNDNTYLWGIVLKVLKDFHSSLEISE